MQIVILDDDAPQARQIESLLSACGHICTIVLTTASLISLLRRSTFDLLILDWVLPDGSGLEVVQWVRKNILPPPPMLMVTARTDEADVVSALTAGADDYVTKPVSEAVLTARVEALLRRTYRDAPNDDLERYGRYAFDTAKRSVSVLGAPAALTAKEFDLALMLFRNPNRALSRSYILDAVWGWNSELSSRTLDIHISRVRLKLFMRPENGVRLAPIYGYGYRLEVSILLGSVDPGVS